MLKRLFLYIICSLSLTLSINIAFAKNAPCPLPPQTSLVINGKTGKILHDENSTIKIFPASLTKLMTLYLMFEALESGKLQMNQKIYISEKAEKMLPGKLGLKRNDHITVKDSIPAVAIKSANDISVAIAEHMKGTEAKFAQLMNIKARQLGMKDTHFMNASGWHHPKQKTTARDIAKLSIAIKRDFPQYYGIFAKNSFVFRGKIIKGHNKVNEIYQGSEGLKTGYHKPAGYNLVTAVTRNDKSLVAIVTGGRSATKRDQQMIKLLDKHFDQPNNYKNTANKLVAGTMKNSSKAYKKPSPTKLAVNHNVKNKKKLSRG